jgi:hypothetical protein
MSVPAAGFLLAEIDDGTADFAGEGMIAIC